MDYAFVINLSPIRSLEAIQVICITIVQRDLFMNWIEENQILLIIDLLKVYFWSRKAKSTGYLG